MDVKDYGCFAGSAAEECDQAIVTRVTVTHRARGTANDERIHGQILTHGCYMDGGSAERTLRR